MINHAIKRAATAAFTAYCLIVGDPSWADTGFDGSRLRPCAPERNCVSTNYLEPPNRYVSPLKLVNDQDKAFQRAVRDLNQAQASIVEVKPEQYYVHLTVPGTAPSSLDDIELVFTKDGIVNVRCDARVTLPIPPFCVKRNCINGNSNPIKQGIGQWMMSTLDRELKMTTKEQAANRSSTGEGKIYSIFLV